jgi:class 3 adenylate cyclase
MAFDLRTWLQTLSERVVTDQDSEQEKLNKQLLIFASALMGFAAMVWVAIYHAMGIRFSSTVPFSYMVISAASLALYLARTDLPLVRGMHGNFPLYRFLQTLLFLFVPFIMQWSIGSYISSSGVMLWALLAPIGVMVFQGSRESLPWFVAYLVLTAVSGFFDYYLAEGVEAGVTMQSIAVFFALNFAAMSTIVYLLFNHFVRQRDILSQRITEQHEQLREEQEKSERLLLNILPGPIAQRLKQQHSVIADGFADVTVMFADIINFTRLSEEMSPRLMVGLLNEVFSHFDQLAERHGLEKIKTIGDAYMVAGGLGEQHRSAVPQDGDGERDYSAAICSMALDMCNYMDTRSGFKRARLQIHVGIGTGPVVAGVIGMKKFIYDLWGDTVNIASRVTDEAGASQILVDAVTYRRVRHLFEFGEQQTLTVKGKGEIAAYRLVGYRTQVQPRAPATGRLA